jgi:hypothetical protein
VWAAFVALPFVLIEAEAAGGAGTAGVVGRAHPVGRELQVGLDRLQRVEDLIHPQVDLLVLSTETKLEATEAVMTPKGANPGAG